MTLSQIAERAEVSIITASRALRGVGRVHPETRRRIHKIATEMNYPSLSGVVFAPRLRKPRTDHPLHVLVAHFSEEDSKPTDSASVRIVAGINQSLQNRGGGLQIHVFRDINDFLHRWTGLRSHGIVVRQPLPRPWLRQMAMFAPVICASAHDHYTGMDVIFINENRAAGIVYEHLFAAGHRRIVWLGVEDVHAPFRQMAETVQDATLIDFTAASNHQVRFGAWYALLGTQARGADEPILILQRDWHHQSLIDVAREAVRQLLARPLPPTAIVAASDPLAFALIDALQERGLKVPQDMSVVGYGGAPDPSGVAPLLTSVEHPDEDLGRAIPELIERRIADPRAVPLSIQLEPSLFIGATVMPLPLRLSS